MHSFTYAIAFGHIIVVASTCIRTDVTTVIDEQWWSTGRQKRSELQHQGEFLHNYYMFESVNDGDHNGAVRIFVGLSCELW